MVPYVGKNLISIGSIISLFNFKDIKLLQNACVKHFQLFTNQIRPYPLPQLFYRLHDSFHSIIYTIQAFQLLRFTIINPNHLNLQTTPNSVCESSYKFLVAIIFIRFLFGGSAIIIRLLKYVFQRRILDRSTSAATEFEDCHYINPLRRCG